MFGGEISQNCRKRRFFKLVPVRARFFLAEGHTNLAKCSNEGSWCVDVPLECLGQIRPQEIGWNCSKYPKIAVYEA